MSSADPTTDVGEIWRAAIDRYEEITKLDIDSLQKANTVEDILSEIKKTDESVKNIRHDGSKSDKFRTLVNRSLKPIETVSEIVAQAGSNSFPPSVAIFTAVRHLIKTAQSVSADYDKISAFFDDLGYYLKRLKTIEGKVPPIPELKSALADVLTSVLTLCGICTKYLKGKRFVKALRTLVSGEDDELASAYDHFHKMVKREESIVGAATLVEVSETKSLLQRSERVFQYVENGEAALWRDNALDDLSKLTFLNTQKDKFAKHHDGTCQWLLLSGVFQRWFKEKQSSTLWCYGDPGSGKTVLTSIIIDYVSEQTSYPEVAIAYIYCNYKEPDTHSELNLLSNIARQLAEHAQHLPLAVKEFRDQNANKKRHPRGDEWVSLIQSLCLLSQKTIVIIDALDECPECSRDRFLYLMQKLETSIHFLFTSRPHIELPDFVGLQQIRVSAEDSDLEAFLYSKIEENRKFLKAIRNVPKMRAEIVRRVIDKASGMFLLASQQIDLILGEREMRGIHEVLDTLSEDIFDYYDKAIERIEHQEERDHYYAKRALSFISHAKRPLAVEELLHALGVQEMDTDFVQDGCLDPDILRGTSVGLIKIDQKSGTIGLVHQTLQEYFEKFPEKLSSDPDSDIATVCLVYLSFRAFGDGACSDGQGLQERLDTHHFLDYSSRYLGRHVNESRRDHTRLIVNYLNDNKKLSSSVQVLYMNSPRTIGWFDRYPKAFSPLHAIAYWGLVQVLPHFLGSIGVDTSDSRGETPLLIAAQHGHITLIKLLLAGGADINAQSHSGETALYWAAKKGNTELAEILLLHGAMLIMDDEGWTAFNWAVLAGELEVVKLLLQKGDDLDIDISQKNNALFLAAEEGRDEIVNLLLDNGADVNAKDNLGSTALDFAVSVAHEVTTEVLLSRNADVDSMDTYGNSALHWAASQETIAHLLVDYNTSVNTKNYAGETALFWAAQNGSTEVAKLLLDNGAGINTQAKDGTTALHRAALKGHESMVRLLLQAGADPDIEDKNKWTPLHGAAVNDHQGLVQLLLSQVNGGRPILKSVTAELNDPKKRVVLLKLAEEKGQGSTVLTGLRVAAEGAQIGRLQMMLEKGADVNAKDPAGYTALELAAFQEHEEVVQLLLDNGADVNLRGSLNRPPLYYAIEQSNENIVPLLINGGADVNVDTYGTAPLMFAVEAGNTKIVQHLLEAGVEVNVRDLFGQTSLHIAAIYGREDIARLLIDNGATLDVTDERGRTALMLAVENKQYKLVALLLMVGASVEAMAQDGSTSLHVAAFMDDTPILKMLLRGGAKINACSGGFTALHIAALMGCEKAVELLLREGAAASERVRWPKVEDSDQRGSLSRDMYEVLEQQSTGCVSFQQGPTALELANIAGNKSVEQLLQ